MNLKLLLLPACLGAGTPAMEAVPLPSSAAAPHVAPAAAPAPVPTPTPGVPVVNTRVDVSLPANKVVPLLDGTIRLVEATSDHTADGREISAGTIELIRGGAAESVHFDANRPFKAWGLDMVVFGASGSYQVSVFPAGTPIRP